MTIVQLHEHGRYRSHHSHRLVRSPSYHPQARLSSRQITQTWTSPQPQARGRDLEVLTETIADIHTLLHPLMITSPPRWPDLRPALQLLGIYDIVVRYHTRRINLDDR